MRFKPSLKPFEKIEKAETGNQTAWFGQEFPKPETGNPVSVWFKPSLSRFETKLPQHYTGARGTYLLIRGTSKASAPFHLIDVGLINNSRN